jgi:hypothetical protein
MLGCRPARRSGPFFPLDALVQGLFAPLAAGRDLTPLSHNSAGQVSVGL